MTGLRREEGAEGIESLVIEMQITTEGVIKLGFKMLEDDDREHVLLYVDVQGQETEAEAGTGRTGGIGSPAPHVNQIQVLDHASSRWAI
jgi:hypothetical protein